MKRPKLVTATQAEIDEILALAKTTLPCPNCSNECSASSCT
jgi:hypothetical protein